MKYIYIFLIIIVSRRFYRESKRTLRTAARAGRVGARVPVHVSAGRHQRAAGGRGAHRRDLLLVGRSAVAVRTP